MEALVVKWHIPELSTDQLPLIIAPGHRSVAPKLIVVWAPVCSLLDQNQEIYQIWHHSLSILSNGGTCSEVGYTQRIYSPYPDTNCKWFYHQASHLWIRNSDWCGHQYVHIRIKTRKSIKTDIIPCPKSVMEAVVVKWDILNLSRYQLRMNLPPGHPSVDPKLIMVWAQVYSEMDQNQWIYHIWHHSLPKISDGSSFSQVGYTQPPQIPIAGNNCTNPLCCCS